MKPYQSPVRWYHYYILAVIGLTCVAFRNDYAGLLYAIPFNLLLYFVPVWVVVRSFRRKPVADEIPQEVDKSIYDQLPNMERK
jgi:hypothetical protein